MRFLNFDGKFDSILNGLVMCAQYTSRSSDPLFHTSPPPKVTLRRLPRLLAGLLGVGTPSRGAASLLNDLRNEPKTIFLECRVKTN